MSSPPPSSFTIRPWHQFINPITLPISISEATHRLTQNLQIFLPNYVVLTLLIFLLTLITRPLTLILFLTLFSVSIYLLFNNDDETLTLFGFDIDRRFILGFIGLVGFVLVFWVGVWGRVFVSVLIGGFVVLVHGVLRDAGDDGFENSPYGNLLNDGGGDGRGAYSSV